jgi:hypothetical protein
MYAAIEGLNIALVVPLLHWNQLHQYSPQLRCLGVLFPPGKEWLEAESLIASALQRAKSASSLGLQLSTYRSYPACAGAVLQWLPTYYMRTLELGPRAEYSR